MLSTYPDSPGYPRRTTVNLTARHASLADIAQLLQEQRGRALDIVAPASSIRSEPTRSADRKRRDIAPS